MSFPNVEAWPMIVPPITIHKLESLVDFLRILKSDYIWEVLLETKENRKPYT